MSTDNRITVTATVHAERLVSCNDPLGAATQAVAELVVELGHFDGEVEVAWKCNSQGQSGRRRYMVRRGIVDGTPTLIENGPVPPGWES